MFKWERRLVETIDRKLPTLAFLMVTLFAFYMRRTGYWHTSFDLENHFYSELPAYLHTPFYTILIRLLPAISISPAKQVKILVCLFDFGVALGAVHFLKQQAVKNKTALLACYTLLLVSPLTIETGLIWIHLDSICMFTLLLSLALYEKRYSIAAGILLGVGVALLTQYAVSFIILAIYGLRKKKTISIFLSTGVITSILLNVASIGILGLNWQKGLFMLVNWLTTDPKNGETFSGMLPWLKTMPAYFGYMAGTLFLIAAFWKPKYRFPAAAIHVILFLYIGHILQYGW